MTTYFTDKSFKVLRALARNNERAWFQAHKADYDAHVRGPFQALLADLQPELRAAHADDGTKQVLLDRLQDWGAQLQASLP
jgi:uncharacterized protein (DUF2461 family)